MKFKTIISFIFLLTAFQANAGLIQLTPLSSGAITAPFSAANQELNEINTAFNITLKKSDLIYKSDDTDSELPATPYYSTTFTNTPSDPSDALIEWTSVTDFIDCSSNCYLALKDGNNDPGWYFFNISAWNGMDDISLSGFWPGDGSISHLSIWNGGGEIAQIPVPVPASVWLLGSAFISIVGIGRRKQI